MTKQNFDQTEHTFRFSFKHHFHSNNIFGETSLLPFDMRHRFWKIYISNLKRKGNISVKKVSFRFNQMLNFTSRSDEMKLKFIDLTKLGRNEFQLNLLPNLIMKNSEWKQKLAEIKKNQLFLICIQSMALRFKCFWHFQLLHLLDEKATRLFIFNDRCVVSSVKWASDQMDKENWT